VGIGWAVRGRTRVFGCEGSDCEGSAARLDVLDAETRAPGDCSALADAARRRLADVCLRQPLQCTNMRALVRGFQTLVQPMPPHRYFHGLLRVVGSSTVSSSRTFKRGCPMGIVARGISCSVSEVSATASAPFNELEKSIRKGKKEIPFQA